jgi:hypothetical protein
MKPAHYKHERCMVSFRKVLGQAIEITGRKIVPTNMSFLQSIPFRPGHEAMFEGGTNGKRVPPFRKDILVGTIFLLALSRSSARTFLKLILHFPVWLHTKVLKSWWCEAYGLALMKGRSRCA